MRIDKQLGVYRIEIDMFFSEKNKIENILLDLWLMLNIMHLKWVPLHFQTIPQTINIRMAGIVFYHPKLGEKRHKILEEAFK